MTSYPNDQGNPAGAIPVWLAGGSHLNLTTSINDQVKSGPGVFSGLVVATGGTASSVAFYDGLSSAVTMTIAVPGVVTWTAHSLAAGAAVEFTTTGALPSGLTAGTVYYVSSSGLTANTFKVADTKAHAIAGTNSITTTGTQSGVHTGWNVSNPIATFATTTQGNIPMGTNGVAFTLGLIAIAADGGGAANLSILYR